MAGIGFPRSHPGAESSSPHIQARVNPPLRCYEQPLRVQKVLAALDFFRRAEIRRPRCNRRKIKLFHARNQTANAHVQFGSVDS